MNLKLNEIHIKLKLSYRAGQIVCSADNQKERAASWILDIVLLVAIVKITRLFI